MSFEKKESKKKMHNFVFTWDASGSTVVRATTLAKAEERFNEDREGWLYQQVSGVPGSEMDEFRIDQVYDQDAEDSDLTLEADQLRDERLLREQAQYRESRQGKADERKRLERKAAAGS
jgi:hypothetical protein